MTGFNHLPLWLWEALHFTVSSNPAVKWSWMFTLILSCPSFAIKFELIVLWSFKQMSTQWSEPKVTEIIQRSGMLRSQDTHIVTAIVSAVLVSVDTATSSYAHQNSKETITQSDKDGGRVVFGDRGLKVSDRKIKDSSSSEFTLLVCVTQDSSGTGLLLSVRTQWEKKKKLALFQHMSGRQVQVRVPVYVIFCVWLLYWHRSVIFDSNDVGPSQIDRRGRREWVQEWETRQEENESNRAWEREKLSHSEATVDNSRLWFCRLPVFLFSLCLFSACLFFLLSVCLPFLYLHPSRLSIQGHKRMSFNTAGQPCSLSLRKWG